MFIELSIHRNQMTVLKMRRAKSVGNPSNINSLSHKKDNSQKPAEVSTNSPDDADSQENANASFELELRWCIEKLQLLLSGSNLSQKQTEIKGKALHILTDTKAPIIKKRSVMRNSLGDYRTQMKEEEQKFLRESRNMKVMAVAPSNQKGTYIKKCSGDCLRNEQQAPQFKFNFPIAEVSTDSS